MKQDLVNLHHARSQKDFPDLKLEDNEFVELAITRSPLGLFAIWGTAGLGLLLIIIVSILLTISDTGLASSAVSYLYLILLIVSITIAIIAFVASKVYRDNRLFVTNKRLIHHQANSFFNKSVNIIDLTAIEDVSFKQTTLVDMLFHIGTIRMSTVGDETTYTFQYVDTPKGELDLIAHLVHTEKERAKRRSGQSPTDPDPTHNL